MSKFYGFLIVMLLGLSAAPAYAQDGDPAWVGVWQGTVGKYPVVACLDTSWREGEGRGSYYYLSQLKPIPLRSEDENPDWNELDTDWKIGAVWQWEKVTPQALEGKWSDGKKTLDIRLTPSDWRTPDAPALPCEAPAYFAPRLTGGEVVMEAGATDGIAFIKHEYRSPEHIDVTIAGFELMGDQPGDEVINLSVAAYRPTGSVTDDWVECMSGALAVNGRDGYFERTARPSMLSDEFVSVSIAGSVYCGGAHPSHFSTHRLFDRQSSEEIKLDSWFDQRGFAENEYGSLTITPALRDMVLSFVDAESDEAECVGIAGETDYWDMGLTRDGITFKADLPHIATACENPIAVPWSALDPWLSETGKTGKARLTPSVG